MHMTAWTLEYFRALRAGLFQLLPALKCLVRTQPDNRVANPISFAETMYHSLKTTCELLNTTLSMDIKTASVSGYETTSPLTSWHT